MQEIGVIRRLFHQVICFFDVEGLRNCENVICMKREAVKKSCSASSPAPKRGGKDRTTKEKRTFLKP